jgi:hypothetical protein
MTQTGVGMLGPESNVINGQLVALRPQYAISPIAYGAALSTKQAPIPTIPPAYSSTPDQSGMGNASGSAAQAFPFSFTKSPLPIAVIFLVVGLLGLRFIHWHK